LVGNEYKKIKAANNIAIPKTTNGMCHPAKSPSTAANIKTDRPADIADRTTDCINMVMNAFGLSPK